MLTRRQLLRTTMLAGGALTLPRWARAIAAPTRPERVLVIVQLEGGNDSLSTLVPWRDDLYWSLRPALAEPRDELLELDEWHALHPALARLRARHARGQIACVQNVGYPRPNLSHFRSKDIWDTAACEDPLPGDGWLGRIGARTPLARAALGAERLPRSMWTSDGSACAISSLGGYRLRSAARGANASEAECRERAVAMLHRCADAGPEARMGQAYRAAELSIRELRRTEAFTPQVDFPASTIGRDLEAVARVLGAGIETRLFHVAQPGYDTHTGQRREHAELLAALDLALEAFLQEMEHQGRLEEVLVMTISDFGRRARENGIGNTAGTDHGAAGLQILCGGRVKGGIYGGQVDLEHLDEHGNLTAKVDFRQVYATVVEKWFGTDSKSILGAKHACLDLLDA